ncbi:MAG: UDP-N-acetylmuramoyl-tripeptide--D-alanyl-D-alanine ligase [Candidatus Omnitrophica bacterium]|nr:UDP-N-acetylmuramoyl-tripeptide--D-alanyl-D-alanine ligase [Candidatus Omnitrophota bacterium]
MTRKLQVSACEKALRFEVDEMLSVDEIVQVTNGKLVSRSRFERFTSVSTDTRTLEKGALFFALRGEKYDGHQFLNDAFQKSAATAVIDEKGYQEFHGRGLTPHDRCLLVVSDVYQALGALAKAYREKFNIPVIAITGSAGKTTTKECLKTLLGMQWRVCGGVGNLNNHIGLPLNLFKLTPSDQVAVFEFGASAPGEICYLSSLAKPSVGVITCIHPAHLKGFGSLDKIYESKCELGEFLAKEGGTLIVLGDDPRLLNQARKFKGHVISFGRSEGCEYRLTQLAQTEGFISFTINQKFKFQLKGFGLFNAFNALAALSVMRHLGFDLKALSNKWNELVSVPNRFEVETLDAPSIQVVKDCYNANPKAFLLALESFCSLAVIGKRIVVVGDMKELGGDAERYHRDLGKTLAEKPLDLVIAIGDYSKVIADTIQIMNYRMPVLTFNENQKIGEFLVSILHDGDGVFLKGSRSMKLEEVTCFLKKENSTQVVA